jgi:hypothetical protein
MMGSTVSRLVRDWAVAEYADIRKIREKTERRRDGGTEGLRDWGTWRLGDRGINRLGGLTLVPLRNGIENSLLFIVVVIV